MLALKRLHRGRSANGYEDLSGDRPAHGKLLSASEKASCIRSCTGWKTTATSAARERIRRSVRSRCVLSSGGEGQGRIWTSLYDYYRKIGRLHRSVHGRSTGEKAPGRCSAAAWFSSRCPCGMFHASFTRHCCLCLSMNRDMIEWTRILRKGRGEEKNETDLTVHETLQRAGAAHYLVGVRVRAWSSWAYRPWSPT